MVGRCESEDCQLGMGEANLQTISNYLKFSYGNCGMESGRACKIQGGQKSLVSVSECDCVENIWKTMIENFK